MQKFIDEANAIRDEYIKNNIELKEGGRCSRNTISRLLTNSQELMTESFEKTFINFQNNSKRIEYATFGSCDLYSPSFVEDILITNNNRGKIIKKMTSSTKSYHKYGFDNNDTLLYGQTFLGGIEYMQYISLYKNFQTLYRIHNYVDDRITRFWLNKNDSWVIHRIEEAIFDPNGMLQLYTICDVYSGLFWQEWYYYSNDKLAVCIWNGNNFERTMGDMITSNSEFRWYYKIKNNQLSESNYTRYFNGTLLPIEYDCPPKIKRFILPHIF